MEIKIKKQIDETVNIDLPYYCTNGYFYCAILSETRTIHISTCENWNEISERISYGLAFEKDFEQIKADEFFAKFTEISVKLLKQLV